MKQHPFLLAMLLTAVVFAACFTLYVISIFAPHAVLPHFHLPNVALLCLLALLLHRFAAPQGPVPLLWTALFAALTFGLLPLCAGLVTFALSWRLALAGAAVMGVLTFLFRSAMDRLRSTPASPLAIPMTAFLLYLATQVFSSIWL